jgi:hypothetical protein
MIYRKILWIGYSLCRRAEEIFAMSSFPNLFRIYLKLGFVFLSLGLSNTTAIPASYASAGWYPTSPGDVIKVRYCLPFSAKSTAYLQVANPPSGFKKNVAKIDLRNLKKTPSCIRAMKDSVIAGSGPFEIEYEWRVNVRGDFALQLYIPTKKRTFFGWPDGIEAKRSIP